MSKYAVLDIGTNSIKFNITLLKGTKLETILDTNNISRLGEGLQNTGKISDEAMDRNVKALSGFLSVAKANQVDEVVAVGTMCLRVASNAKYFINKVKNELDLQIEVIDGKEEARLSYLAVLFSLKIKDVEIAIFDTGGGSTEFILGKGEKLEKRFSTNIGAVGLTEKFLKSNPVTKIELKNMLDYIENFFADLDIKKNVNHLIGIGGTVTGMAAVKHKMEKYDPEIIQGSTLKLSEIERQIRLYQSKTIEERKQIIGLQPKRANIILAGAGIVKILMKKFSVDSLTVSDRGLRHGIMYDRFIKV